MPISRPISDLRNKTPETKNGESNLVVLSAAAYEREQARLRLYDLLAAAEADVRAGDRGAPLSKVVEVLRKARG